MNVVTSVTTFQDAVGMRMSVTYSEVDEATGKIVSDNKRVDRVVTDTTAKSHANALVEFAQTFIDN